MPFSKSLIVEEQSNINKTYKYKSAALFISFLSKHCVFSSSDDNQQKLWLTAKDLRAKELVKNQLACWFAMSSQQLS